MNTKNRYFFWFVSRVRGYKWRDVNWQVLSCPAAWLHGKLADLTHYKMLSYRSSVRGGAAFSPTPQLSGPYRDHSHTNMCVRFFILYMLRQFLHSNIKRIKKNCWIEEVSSFVRAFTPIAQLSQNSHTAVLHWRCRTIFKRYSFF